MKARAFRAGNGELGILPLDVPCFLDACRSDGVEVLCWELWVVDHSWGFETNEPVVAQGRWSGGIPLQAYDIPAVVVEEGDAEEAARQLAEFDFEAEVQPAWLPHVRVNFTLDD